MSAERPRRTLLQKIHDRVRYGLALQESLDLLARRLSVLVAPYFIVLEAAQSLTGDDDAEDLPGSWEMRYLDEGDMQLVSALRTQPRSVGELLHLSMETRTALSRAIPPLSTRSRPAGQGVGSSK